jgi:hypothetical protein
MLDLNKELYLLIQKALTTPLSKVTQTKMDKATHTKIVTQVGPLNLGDFSELVATQVKLGKQIIEGVDPKQPEEEERQIDRVVWVKAPENASPHEDSDPEIPDHPGSGNPQPITELDMTEGDSDEDKAA